MTMTAQIVVPAADNGVSSLSDFLKRPLSWLLGRPSSLPVSPHITLSQRPELATVSSTSTVAQVRLVC